MMNDNEDNQLDSKSSPPSGCNVECSNESRESLEGLGHPNESSDVLNNSDKDDLDPEASQSLGTSAPNVPLEDGVATDGIGEVQESQTIADEVPESCNTEAATTRDTVAVPSETGCVEDQLHAVIEGGAVRAAARRRSSGTKSLYRSTRAIVPGAVAASVTNGATSSSVGTDNASQDDVSSSVARRTHAISSEGRNSEFSLDGDGYLASEEFSVNSFVRRRESGTLPEVVGEEGENSEFESYLVVGAERASTLPPRIVTAQVVDGDATMDQSERRRIVQETIQSISDQAVTAEIMHHDGDKLSRKNRFLIFTLIVVVVVFVVVLILVVVFTTRKSGSPKEVIFTPTPSPTVFADDSVFRSTEELYQAVDAYRMSTWNVSNQSSFESSDVALRYGYPISSWNVSLITNFSYVFDPTRFAPDIPWYFNEDLGDWDVSDAETMAGMFMNAYSFQGMGLEKWNVGKVKDFSNMFYYAGFNGTISEWDVSSAESMIGMFCKTLHFNGDLSKWDVSRVQSMLAMFADTEAYEGLGLEHWNVHNVRDFSYMFGTTHKFNGSVASWNTSSAETMEGMFSFTLVFNDDLSRWDVSKVTNMISMFYFAAEYTGEGIENWDVSKVEIMDGMFSDTAVFNGDVAPWDVSTASSLSSLFFNAASFNQNLSAWDVSRVYTTTYLFFNAVRFNGDVSTWDVANVLDFTSMFSGCSTFNGNLSSWNTSSAENMNNMFGGATKFQGHGLSNWDTSSVTSFHDMFADAESFNGDISNWNVSNAENFKSMFDGASSFNRDISKWNVSNVLDATSMFRRATSFNQSLCPWKDILPSMVSLDRIFADSGCEYTADPTLNGTTFCASCVA